MSGAVVDAAPAGNGGLATQGLLNPASVLVSLYFGMSPLELDGYLTGVLVAPNLIPPARWIPALWGDDEPAFDPEQVQSTLRRVALLSNDIEQRIAQSLRRLESERVCDYRPAYVPPEGEPSRDAIRTWVRGFWRAMALAPSDWSGLVADERMQPIITPFVGFIELGTDGSIELAEDFHERLDEAAAMIPRSILLLRKIADLRASRPGGSVQTRRTKVGRNDPCPCGSSAKFKRCCGA